MDLMEYLESAREFLFRWESLQEYRVDGEDEGMGEWWEFIERKTKGGVIMERVRLIIFPMNDYTEREIKTHKHSVVHGDDIRYVDAHDIKEEYPSCFWLIDDTLVLKMHYSKNGEYQEFTVEKDARDYVQFKKRVLSLSKPIIEL